MYYDRHLDRDARNVEAKIPNHNRKGDRKYIFIYTMPYMKYTIPTSIASKNIRLISLHLWLIRVKAHVKLGT